MQITNAHKLKCWHEFYVIVYFLIANSQKKHSKIKVDHLAQCDQHYLFV